MSTKNAAFIPRFQELYEMKAVFRLLEKENTDYAEFMMHSSGFMPAGSPYFVDETAVNSMFASL